MSTVRHHARVGGEQIDGSGARDVGHRVSPNARPHRHGTSPEVPPWGAKRTR
jgi:hypothetical protein